MERSDLVYVKNLTNECLDEFYCNQRYVVPNDDKPHLLPKELFRKFLTRRWVREIEDVDKYFNENPNIELNYLIIRDGGLGDLILLEPCLRRMKREFPNCTLTVACHYLNIPLVENIECVDNVVDMVAVNTNDYDMYIDLRYYSETHKQRAQKHRTDIYCDGLPIEFENDSEKRPVFNFPKYKLPYKIKKDLPICVIQCGTSHLYRDYPHTEELAKQLSESMQVILIDYNMHFSKIYDNENILDLRCGTTVTEMINIISQADIVISPDSGAMHISLAQNIPTIGLFGIIRPELRVKYYNKNNNKMFYISNACQTPHCGEWHMQKCNVSQSRAHCMVSISVESIIKETEKILKKVEPQSRVSKIKRKVDTIKDEPTGEKPVYQPQRGKAINTTPQGKLTIVAICYNEEHNIPQFINNVMGHPLVGRTVVIDGGSTDKSVEMLKDAGAEVYIHPYNKDYHDQQAVQRNISFTYVKNGERCLIMDFDECFSATLYKNLNYFLTCKDPYIGISRRTYNLYVDAMQDRNQIKDYPDYQPRFFIWDHKFKFIRSPHHIIVNAPTPAKCDYDILHFEKEGKDRGALERDWSVMEERTRKYYG